MKIVAFYISIILLFVAQTTTAQCYPDRHSTSWIDSWISCDTSENPNPVYGESHWIMYDLGIKYVLKDTKFWNTNEPANLNYGIQDFNIDYSTNGSEWVHLGEFKLNQASGKSNYEGEIGPDFDGVKARYVLITPISNFGSSCYGFSELKINIVDPFKIIDENIGFNASVYPNPFVDNASLRIVSLHDNYPVSYTLYDLLGRQISQKTISMITDQETYELNLNGRALALGIYLLKVEHKGKQRTFKLIKNN